MIESTMDGSTAIAAINKAFEYGKDVEITDGIDFGFAEESSQNPISSPMGAPCVARVNAYGVAITINGGGAVINHGTLKIDSLNVEDGGTLTNGEDRTINNDGIFDNYGKIDNDGTINNAADIATARSKTTARSTQINTAGAIGNSNSGTIENAGTIAPPAFSTTARSRATARSTTTARSPTARSKTRADRERRHDRQPEHDQQRRHDQQQRRRHALDQQRRHDRKPLLYPPDNPGLDASRAPPTRPSPPATPTAPPPRLESRRARATGRASTKLVHQRPAGTWRGLGRWETGLPFGGGSARLEGRHARGATNTRVRCFRSHV